LRIFGDHLQTKTEPSNQKQIIQCREQVIAEGGAFSDYGDVAGDESEVLVIGIKTRDQGFEEYLPCILPKAGLIMFKLRQT